MVDLRAAWRSLGRRLLAVIAGLAAAILVVEVLLRLLGTSMPPPPLYPGDRQAVRDGGYDAHLGWKMPPDAVIRETKPEYSVVYRSNSWGFRSTPDLSNRTASRRFVFLGDSYTFGSGVESDETFVSRLANSGAETVAHNLGMGGFGVDQMWLALEHYGLRLEPTHVVLTFIRNDLDRTLSAYRSGHVWLEKPQFRLTNGELERVTVDNRPPAWRRWVTQRTRWAGLWRRVENSLSRRYPVGYRWALNRAVFARIRDVCREAGARLLVVHLPVNRLHAVPVLESEFFELEIAFLDLAGRLPPDAASLYYPEDRHLNADGHAFVAAEIERWLAANGER